jgi:hypothetical protein
MSLVGCTTSSDEPPPPSAAAPAEEVVEPAGDAGAASCLGVGDVLTIVENADLALDEGRIEEQEHQGWYRLATRVLARLPVGGDGAVDAAVADLQAAAPPVALGAASQTSIGSADWADASNEVREACEEIGVDVALEIFTGG